MKKIYLFVFAAFSLSAISLTTLSKKEIGFKEAYKNSHLRNSNGASNGKTGAPGESDCTQCHSGTVQSGTGINNVTMIDNATQSTVTQYNPGSTYTITITTAAATKKGFQLSPRILSNDTQAGTSAGVSGSTTASSFGGNQYINHTSASNTSQTGWAFTWTAPATDVGDVRFYLATNISNNNGSSNGDIIRLSQHTFSAAPVVVNPPVASFTSSSNSVCAGNTISFTSTSTGNPTAVLWSFPGGTPNASIDPNPTVTYSTAGNFSVTLTATNDGGTDDLTTTNAITVNSAPTLNVISSTNPSTCSGTDGSITIGSTEADGILNWTGTAAGNQTGLYPQTISNLGQGTYDINDLGFVCPTNILNFSLTGPGAPATPTIASSDLDNEICQGTSLTLTTNNATGNLWSTGETTQSISVSTAGNYTVSFTETGCTATSQGVTVTVISCASLNENNDELVLIYPNPTNESLTLKNIELTLFSSIELVDLSGKVLQTWNISSSEENLTLKNIKAGSYFIKIKGEKEITKTITVF